MSTEGTIFSDPLASGPEPLAPNPEQSERPASGRLRPTEEGASSVLKRFLTTSPAALSAAESLNEGAEVAISFVGMTGEWRVTWDGAKAVMEPGQAQDPDFDLRLSRAAVYEICTLDDAAVGDLGVAFFEHIVAADLDRKIWVRTRSGVVKLARRGWLRLLARGGPRLIGWMSHRGLRGPGAIMTALARLRKNEF